MLDTEIFFEKQRSECDQLAEQNRLSEAIYVAEKSGFDALVNLGLLYASRTHEYEKALSCFFDALKIIQADWVCWCNICHAYTKLFQHDLALQAALKSIKYSHEKSYGCFYNAGVIFLNLRKLTESEDMFRKALEINPQHISSKYNLAMTLLTQKKYAEGWKLYEHRFDEGVLTKKCRSRFAQPDWNGEPIPNRSLLIFSEQGIGDFIFFSRFLPQIRNLVGKIIVEVQEPLVNLIQKNFAVDEVIGRDNSLTGTIQSDYCLSVSSLAHVLKIDADHKIVNAPYIHANFNKAAKIRKVGICWAGSPVHKSDYLRSIPISDWQHFLKNDSLEFYSFIVNTPSKRIWNAKEIYINQGVEKFQINNIFEKLTDFQELSEKIAEMDLVVTVDTGLAHLCGAMGMPVFILLSKESDWRWAEDNQTVWYPSAKLFRKKTSWSDLLAEVNEAISFQNSVD